LEIKILIFLLICNQSSSSLKMGSFILLAFENLKYESGASVMANKCGNRDDKRYKGGAGTQALSLCAFGLDV
jgi:hypothetical protein